MVNGLTGRGAEVYYWREAHHKVDFAVKEKGRVVAFEITSSRRKDSLPGLVEFASQFKAVKQLLIGGQGIPPEKFLATSPQDWISR